MVAAAGLSPRGAFNPGFIAYLLIMVWVLVQYHLLVETEHSQSAQRLPPDGFAAWTATAAGLALITSGILFLFLPRMGLELLGGSPQNNFHLSGFSPEVRLGVIGPVKRDPTIVMRVSGALLGPSGQPLYLRGAVFDAFDGRNWIATAPSRHQLPVDGEGRFEVGHAAVNPAPIVIQAEPLDTSVIFTPDHTASLEGPFAAVLMDDDEVFSAPYSSGTRQTYDVWQRALDARPPSPHAASPRYLRLDESSRVAALAEQATIGLDTPVGKAVAIERFLRTRYSYTLDIPGGDDRPLDAFLFDRRSGYCEHFASAMAVMLRAVGVPTRLVTGFLVQEWNAVGKYAVVRQGDAHAWVEAYLSGSGWTRFDPTPPVPPADRPWTGSADHYLDALRTGWNRYVLDFSLRDQHEAIESAEASWSRVQALMSALWTDSTRRVMRVSDAAWIAGGLVAVTLFALGLAVSVRRSLAAAHPGRTASVAFYHRLLRALERQGVAKPMAATPAEFAERDTARLVSSAAIRRVTARYYEVRYGRRQLSAEERRQLETDLTTIEHAP
jgi:hypothetical protein